MAYLTINADDFGMTHGVTFGIHKAITQGVVTSTSAMTCIEGTDNHLEAFAAITNGAIGAHLQLTTGNPILPPEKVPSLVNENGSFPAKSKMLSWNINPDEIYAEWNAQIAKLEEWGVSPAYLDSHHHVHLMGQIMPVIAKLGKEKNIPVRSGSSVVTKKLRYLGVSAPDITILEFYGKDLNVERLRELLTAAVSLHGNDAVIELCCHPGMSSNELTQLSVYDTERETELDIFLKGEVREMINDLGFQLIGMDQVRELRP